MFLNVNNCIKFQSFLLRKSMENILPVVLFAISSSITPGPNNIMVLTSGVNFGVRRSIPLLIGITVGFAIMLVIVGLGFGQIFSRFPVLQFVIKCMGVIYLLYLSYLIARSSNEIKTEAQSKPLSFTNGALFQWVNAKAWVVATSAIVAFTGHSSEYHEHLIVAMVFLLVALPCVGSWLIFGRALKHVLQSVKHRIYFNYAMAIMLVGSVVTVCIDIFNQLIAAYQ